MSIGSRSVRAARLVRHGDPLVVEAVALDEPGGDEVVVEMSYAGVNPVDRYAVLGRVAPDAPLPRTVGVEGVGTLDGRSVVVHGSGLGIQRDGTWAEAAVVPRPAVVDVPEGVDPVAAGAMGVAGVTAWRTVTDFAQVGPDDRVLVLGASGGVGSMIVTLVRSTGAVAWGQTGREAMAGVIEARGATRAIVAGDGPALVEAARVLRPTVVFDPLGADFTGAAVELLEPYGRLVLYGTSASPEGRVPFQALYRKNLRLLGYGGLMEPQEALRRGMEGALQALRDGRLVVSVDEVLVLDEVNDALDRLARRRVSGKVVLALR